MRRALLVLPLLVACQSATAEPPPQPVTKSKTAAAKKAAPAKASTTRSAIGTNLNAINFRATNWAFIDSVKAGTSFISCTDDKWDDKRRIELGPKGWPKELANGQRARMLLPSQEGGRMVARWKGRGTLLMESTGAKVEGVKAMKQRLEFTVPPNVDLLMSIVDTDPKDPLREVQVFPKRLESKVDEVFHPKFVERLRPFSVLRFMDWGVTNSSPLSTWAKRPLPTDRSQSSGRGVAYEVMIDLANRADAGAWINIPHQADDDFVTQLAKLCAERLDPKHKLYVEYSNEVWHDHPLFSQSAYAREQGTKLGLSDNPDVARLRYQARRSLEIFRIFEAHVPPERLVRVIGSQVGNHYAHAELMTDPEVKKHTDAIAVAPYFGHELGSQQAAKKFADGDIEAMMKFLEDVSIPAAYEAIRLSTEWGKKNGVALVAYEGGQHLAAEPALVDDAAWNAKLDAANRHPAMKARYFDLLNAWKRAGGHEFVHFTFTSRMEKFGRFGALEAIDQPLSEAPKYDALVAFAKEHPVWW